MSLDLHKPSRPNPRDTPQRPVGSLRLTVGGWGRSLPPASWVGLLFPRPRCQREAAVPRCCLSQVPGPVTDVQPPPRQNWGSLTDPVPTPRFNPRKHIQFSHMELTADVWTSLPTACNSHCSHGYAQHSPTQGNPIPRCDTKTSDVFRTCLIDIHQALHRSLEQAGAWTQATDSPVGRGPASRAGPEGKAREGKAARGHTQAAHTSHTHTWTGAVTTEVRRRGKGMTRTGGAWKGRTELSDGPGRLAGGGRAGCGWPWQASWRRGDESLERGTRLSERRACPGLTPRRSYALELINSARRARKQLP